MGLTPPFPPLRLPRSGQHTCIGVPCTQHYWFPLSAGCFFLIVYQATHEIRVYTTNLNQAGINKQIVCWTHAQGNPRSDPRKVYAPARITASTSPGVDIVNSILHNLVKKQVNNFFQRLGGEVEWMAQIGTVTGNQLSISQFSANDKFSNILRSPTACTAQLEHHHLSHL